MPDWWLEDPNGGLYRAVFSPLTVGDTQQMRVSQGWSKGLTWRNELYRPGNSVWKITDMETKTIQGVISLREKRDHVYVNLIESAPHNRSHPKIFVNIARVLIAFAGKRSIEIGADGFIALKPKDSLRNYYVENFRAFPLLDRNVGIADVVTKYWIRIYFR